MSSCSKHTFATSKFIETIQIDQWERFPPKKNLSIKNQSEAASFCLSDEFGKTEPMKTFDSSNQSEKNPALVIFKFKIHHFYSNSRSERGRIVDYSL
jgi:hypothetical protein